MSYNKTNWQTGDIVTAEKLNKMEGGIENANNSGDGCILYVEVGEDEKTLNKTISEIKNAINNNAMVILKLGNVSIRPSEDDLQFSPLRICAYSPEQQIYGVVFDVLSNPFLANSVDDYPVLTDLQDSQL